MVLKQDAYVYEAEDVRIVDNSKFEGDLKRYHFMQQRLKKDAEILRQRQREALKLKIFAKAQEKVLARERAEEEARSLAAAQNTVPAQLVKDEADAILAEAQETLDKARAKEDEAIKLLAGVHLRTEDMLEESRAQGKAEAEAARIKAVEEGTKAGMAEGLLKGTQDGEVKGMAQGLVEGRKDLDEVADKLEKILEALPDRIDAAVRSLEEDVVATVRVISQRVIAGELSQPNEVIVNIVKEALGEVRDNSKIIVRVNSADVMACRRHRKDFLESAKGKASLRIIEDDTVDPGGCLIDTEGGRLDAQMETRSQAALRTLSDDPKSGDRDAS